MPELIKVGLLASHAGALLQTRMHHHVPRLRGQRRHLHLPLPQHLSLCPNLTPNLHLGLVLCTMWVQLSCTPGLKEPPSGAKFSRFMVMAILIYPMMSGARQ